MHWLPALLPALLLAGSWVFCVLTFIAAKRYRAVRPKPTAAFPPVSILKPLHGLDEGLEENLRSFFTQDYPDFEILFAARDPGDPGLALATRLSAEYPHVRSRTFVTGNPPYPNAKSWSLEIMTREASHDLLVMSDSDIRVTPEMLQVIAAEFQDPRLAVATCPYRAVPGCSPWSTLEAIGMNTEFWGGAFVARLVEGGVGFAVGPTIAARRQVLVSLGGWPLFAQYLAEDFVLGQLAARAGHGVILSSYVIEHRIGAQGFRANLAHRLRWNRSTRRSRPAGYAGQIFTYPLPILALLMSALPALWHLSIPTLVLRAAAAYAVSESVLHDPLCRRLWWAIPIQDLLSFALWIAGFFGDTIIWRGRRFRLLKDGRFEEA